MRFFIYTVFGASISVIFYNMYSKTLLDAKNRRETDNTRHSMLIITKKSRIDAHGTLNASQTDSNTYFSQVTLSLLVFLDVNHDNFKLAQSHST